MTSNKGGRPIRKRGYHRAIKRGESWAGLERITKVLIDNFNRDLFVDEVKSQIYNSSPFYALLKKET